MSKKSAETRAERTAALIKEQQQQEYRRKLRLIAAIMLVLAVIAGVGVFFAMRADKTSTSTVKASDYALTIGDPNAPTKVVVYEDFLCPACGYFESVTSEKLVAAADAGKVYVEYRAFYFLQDPAFEEYSRKATNAFRAVWEQEGPEAAKMFHDSLFTDQVSESGPFPDDDFFVEKAVAAGATEATIRPAIENLEYADWVDAATSDASEIRSTPTVYLNGKIVESGSLDDTAKIVFDAIG